MKNVIAIVVLAVLIGAGVYYVGKAMQETDAKVAAQKQKIEAAVEATK